MPGKQLVCKTSVTILTEYCSKRKLSAPTYKWIDSKDGVFICRVYVMDTEVDGIGRSKRDAKHMAAANAIKKLRLQCDDTNKNSDVDLMDSNETPVRDMIVTLRDYCVQHNHPLPTIEIVQEGGTPHAPKFVALCAIASIQRIAISDKKKDARQKAAAAMFHVIQGREFSALEQTHITPLDDKITDDECERYQKFKTYRELTENYNGNGNINMSGTLLCERHNYFENFYDTIKTNAKAVLSDETYENEHQQVMDLFKALKITPKIKKIPAEKTMESMVCVDINCDYDAHFMDLESKIDSTILEYFRDMLS